MTRRTIDSVASAVVRRLQSQGRRTSPVSALVASLAAPQSRRPGPGAAVASAAVASLATRRGRKPRTVQPVDILANKLASAVTRRLAGSPAAKPGIPLAASRLTKGIVRKVGKQLGRSPGVEPVSLGTIDPAATAKALTSALGSLRATPADPAAAVASTILQRLRTTRFVGTTADAQAFQDRVASIVTESLRATAAEASVAEARQTATISEPTATAAASGPAEAPVEATIAASRKRDQV